MVPPAVKTRMGAEMLFTRLDPYCLTVTITAACHPSGIALSSTTRTVWSAHRIVAAAQRAHEREPRSDVFPTDAEHTPMRPGRVAETCSRRNLAGLTVKPLSCAARALVPEPKRRAACLHVRRAMQAA